MRTINEIYLGIHTPYDLPIRTDGDPYFFAFRNVVSLSMLSVAGNSSEYGFIEVVCSEKGSATYGQVTRRGDIREIPYHEDRSAYRFDGRLQDTTLVVYSDGTRSTVNTYELFSKGYVKPSD